MNRRDFVLGAAGAAAAFALTGCDDGGPAPLTFDVGDVDGSAP